MQRPPALAYVTISSPDTVRLTEFYRALTSSDIVFADGPFTVLGRPEEADAHRAGIAFQSVAAGQPSVAVHLDLYVDDIDVAAAEVERLGGRLGSKHEEVGTRWQQAYDPDGNVFCLMARSSA